ncbi:MAG TPA: YifB family Mg chelatase-like AAA ATPase [Candidatus Paceibacterota bacterium]|nr:YifB family Mg chelatase-like AAA ATPase [Candidatus Paceibacterota bacterium]
MNFSRLQSAQVSGLQPSIVTVETDLSRGLFLFSIVGLPDKAVEEARDRVLSALKHSVDVSPKTRNQKIVVSLSPAELKKEGAYFDVSIALGYLLSAGDIAFDPAGKIFVGELALNGEVRPVRGILPIAEAARKAGCTELFIPAANSAEGALVSGITIYPVETLAQLIAHLKSEVLITPTVPQPITERPITARFDFGEVSGQLQAKRALLIAAAGGHNIALYGPPGTGKTMLARSFSGILPPLSEAEFLETAMIYSSVGLLDELWKTHVPFRSPHHTASHVAVVGGGAQLRPGEVTLAHNGILYLDEFPEFDRRVIEALREPLEDRAVTIARAKGSAKYPSRFLLVAALNPCPCGYRGSATRACTCSAHDLVRYKKKLSGPIMDRIDLWVPVGHIEYSALHERKETQESPALREQVSTARAQQHERFSKERLNADMQTKDIQQLVALPPELQTLLESYAKRLELSPRSYLRVIKVARTIADLEHAAAVTEAHLLEALQYRPKFEW